MIFEEEEPPKIFASLIKKYTYFMGMRITTNNMQVTQNTDPKKIEVLPVYRSDIFTTAFDSLNPASLNTT